MIDFTQVARIHFIGIGGIGVSAVARMFLLQGKKVSGSDVSDSPLLDELRKLGAEISIGQSLSFMPKDAELVVYSAAIPVADPELFKKIKALKVPALSYAEALGEISRGKKTIAVSGTHGKTTTTAMIAKVLIDAGRSPTVIVGSLIADPKTGAAVNFIKGDSDLFVAEADEYRRSFLNLNPEILVVTNIDSDHLDYYRDLADIKNAFATLAAEVPKAGAIVTDFNNRNAAGVFEAARAPIFDYSSADISGLKLAVPGEHNRANARAALTVAAFLGVSRALAIESLNGFLGAWRRFEYKGETAGGALVYDDYAHNPQKVRAVLAGAREMFPERKIIAIFQPHLFSRTKTLLHEFADSFSDADEVILVPIFPAREKFDPGVSSEMLAVLIKKNTPKTAVAHFAQFGEAVELVKKNADKNTIVLTVGAGDVHKIGEVLLRS